MLHPLNFLKGIYYLPSLVSILKTSIYTIPWVPRGTQITQVSWQLPTDRIYPCSWVQQFSATSSSCLCILCLPMSKNRSSSEQQISGPITTSMGPLCHSISLVSWLLESSVSLSVPLMTASCLPTKLTNTFWWQLLCCKIIQHIPLDQFFIVG